MELRLGYIKIKGARILYYLSFCLVCLSGHTGISSVQTLGQYLLFGLLILFALQDKVDRNNVIISFCTLNITAFLVSSVYNLLAGNRHFLLATSLKAVLYYCLFAYCGYYIATQLSADRIFGLIRKASIVAIVVIVVQSLCAEAGIYLNRLPILGEYLFYAVDTDIYFRPAAYFSEPSYLAEIVLLDLFNSLFRKRNLRMVIFDFAALALSTSGLGIVFGFGLVVVWAITQRITRNSVLNVLIKFVLVTAFAIGLFAFLNYSGDNAIINRILRGSTLSERTLRAFEIYSKLQPGEQICGIGMQNLTSYLNNHDLILVNAGVGALVNKEFAQSFGYVLLSLGPLGAIAYLIYLCSMARRTQRNYRAIYILFLAMSLTASLITRAIFVLYSSVLWSLILDVKETTN